MIGNSKKILPIIWILISTAFVFPPHFLHAKTIEVDYSIEFGIVGEVAKVHAILSTNYKTYKIDANVLIVGTIAKTVTDNLEERHISTGHIRNGLLVTDTYQMIKSYGNYSSTTIYQINHKKKRVTRHYLKWENSKKIIDNKVMLGYYGRDDLMTFFLNLHLHIKEKYKSRNYNFKVVGADRKNGQVDVNIPSENILIEMKKIVGDGQQGDWYNKVVMYRKLYNSKKGELEVRMGKDGIVDKAVLKDLIFFGDIRIIRQ